MAALFLLLTLTHLWFIVTTQKKFCIPMLIGGICKSSPFPPANLPSRWRLTGLLATVEIVGYGARVVAHYHPDATLPYAIQSLLILLAPILFAASVYMFLGRIIFAVGGEKHCLVPARYLTKIFVCGDVACFFIQSAGGGTLSNAKTASKVQLGEDIVLAGLVLQIVIFGLFVAVATNFHVRMHRNTTAGSLTSLRWQRLLPTLYVASLLITIRNVVRAIEYGMGSDGYFLMHEWVAFVFDGAAMVLVLIVCLAWYYSAIRSKEKVIENHRLTDRSILHA